jgi:hypothetical protein
VVKSVERNARVLVDLLADTLLSAALGMTGQPVRETILGRGAGVVQERTVPSIGRAGSPSATMFCVPVLQCP